MPRGVDKANLPSKVCAACGRPFTWRKVWEKCWDEVQTCSDRCKGERKKALAAKRRLERGEGGGGSGGDGGGFGAGAPPEAEAS